MKHLIIALFSFTVLSTGAMANTEEARADLLKAQYLINSALAKLDDQDFATTRTVKNAQYICRETATTPEVEGAIKSVKAELGARCGNRCTIILEFRQVGYDCQILGKAIR